jgi:tRNA pseudouridine32 synthase/23S rRNA pseudouridine746 synthase/23S rRNA pseudouridine1911/1915/1917 synthase
MMKTLSKKHQPKGFTILFEDQEIIVVDKQHGLLTVGTDREKMKTVHYLLNEYVKKGNERSRNRVYVVHRLDRETSGILLFAKNEKAKNYLQENWQSFHKNYFAVVHGQLKKKEDLITSYLAENKVFIVYSVKDPEKGKLAKTGYTVIKESEQLSLVDITLFTGRKNQIRVHFAELGHPVVGDKVYGKDAKAYKRLALHAASITFTHPHTKKELTFKTPIPDYFKVLVKM